MIEKQIQTKQDKFFHYLNDFMAKDLNSELINLTEIHSHYGSPRLVTKVSGATYRHLTF